MPVININNDDIRLNSSSSDKVVVNGNLGIGTTSPDAVLDVNYKDSTTNIIRVSNGSGNYRWRVDQNFNMFMTNASFADTVGIYNNGNGFFSGNVGIGTTSPAANLHIQGSNAKLRLTGDTYTSIELEDGGTGDPGYLKTYYYGSLVAQVGAGGTFFDTGNVGIGTTSPNQRLSVEGGNIQLNANNAAANYYLFLNKKNGQDGGILFNRDNNNDWQLTNHSSLGDLVFYSYGTASEAITFKKGTGNVGIGTTSPGARLEVVAGNTTSISVRSGNSGQYSILSVGRTSSDIIIASAASSGQFWTGSVAGDGWVGSTNGTLSLGNDTTGVANLTIKSGNVGIGTTAPSYKLQIAEDTYARIALHQTTTGAIWNWGNDGSNMYAYYTNTGVRALDITNTGNVGIGTTSPGAKLDVSGSIQAGSGNTFGTGSNGASIYMSSASGLGLSGNLSGYSRNLIKTDGTSVIEVGDASTSLISAINISAGDAAGVIALKTGGNNTRLYVNSSGNVGIGTTSPVTQLQVASATNAVDVLRIGNTAGDSGSVQGVTHLAINHFNAGTNPSTRITAYQDGVSGWPGGMYFSTRSLNTDSAPVERMRITSGGNVGIGTTSPSNILHITNVMRMDNATGNAPAVTSYTPRNGYGDVETERCLADPAVWLKINIGGTEYVIPAYTQA